MSIHTYKLDKTSIDPLNIKSIEITYEINENPYLIMTAIIDQKSQTDYIDYILTNYEFGIIEIAIVNAFNFSGITSMAATVLIDSVEDDVTFIGLVKRIEIKQADEAYSLVIKADFDFNKHYAIFNNISERTDKDVIILWKPYEKEKIYNQKN